MQNITLIAPDGFPLVFAQGKIDHHVFSGEVIRIDMPDRMRKKFEEYEEIVNGQMFSLLDEIEDQIAVFGIQAVIPGEENKGEIRKISDLQFYPSTGRVSFRLAPAGKLTSTSPT